jgi:serine/threonine-protein kinase RsbT
MPVALRFRVAGQADVERARRNARSLAAAQGLGIGDSEAVALAVSELAANLVRYAEAGEVVLSPTTGSRGEGVEIESRDLGPGIANLELALRDGFSTGGGLGNGLPAVRRLMDEFEISSTASGTRIVARKWPGVRSR